MSDVIMKLLDIPKFGETVLVKYPPSFVPEFMVLKVIQYAKMKNIKVLIDDNFDALAILETRLKILGVKYNFDDVYVIKTGGKRKIGNVIAEIKKTSEPRVYFREYAKSFKEISEVLGKYINIVLGIEELFKSMTNPMEMYMSIFEIQKFLGNTHRKAFYLVNKDVLLTLPFPVRVEFSRIASTVVEVIPIATNAHVRILKATNPDFVGREITVDIGEDL
ncbi:DUF257 family protein [Pyrococcus kukulkanii]|uniref:Uncharacterized protein n=1 Tax=Pyrococcus kukulkanii TaxID=1609559 RepID=A0A127B9R1_9EURY|nr:DUF257 family protein [Pyrococcus kukulkanii]AMM54081.1 hypothetical protein TQ32_06030 [Pyrococcus kukulkanii]